LVDEIGYGVAHYAVKFAACDIAYASKCPFFGDPRGGYDDRRKKQLFPGV
ncbi:unnamed protein product, partial [marine sediment metagenome]